MFLIVEANLSLAMHADAILRLLDEYAREPVGGGKGLSTYTKANLIPTLQRRQGVTIILAFDGNTPVGLAICFEGFSTFACKPLLNIHDFVVTREYRGKGGAEQMLQAVEQIAARKGCCKLTLEVLEGNSRAQAVYRKFGFQGYQLDPAMGQALFWEKAL